VDTGSSLRLQGEGEEGPGGKGDLYVVLSVKPHPHFERRGDDLLSDLTIPFTKAILGGEVDVPILRGRVKMKIPAGTAGGKIFRLKEKGVPHLGKSTSGDQLVKVHIAIPEHLTPKQKELIEEFARLSGN
jgi:molecular chaperone DnaJ